MWIPSKLPVIIHILQIFNINFNAVHKAANVSNVIKYQFSNDAITAANGFAQNRFPDNFLFGFTTSAYQAEGEHKLSDKGESLWDHILHSKPNSLKKLNNTEIAADSYNKFKTDILLAKNLGANTYRISLSWSRILPTGYSDYVSNDGIRYYNDLINEMLKNGINPIITLYDMDLPYKIQQLGGWTNRLIVTWFNDFAQKAFESFGDRVKYWVTINNPYQLCKNGYGGGVPPALNQTGTADYICGHHVLLAHATVYNTYDRDFRWKQKGKVGLALEALWFEVANPSLNEDVEAADRLFQFANGWFLHPILGKSGGYPAIMKTRISEKSERQKSPRSRLPSFKISEILMIRNTVDFLGLNYYSANFVQADCTEILGPLNVSHQFMDLFYNDAGAKIVSSSERIGDSVKNTPWGLKNYFIRINREYKLPPVYILENGYSDQGELYDMSRVIYHNDHLLELLNISKMGFDVRGYLARSLVDAFEWEYGYKKHFGFYHVNYEDAEKMRIPKASTKLIKKIYTKKVVHSLRDFLNF